jgi:hypothetical protein
MKYRFAPLGPFLLPRVHGQRALNFSLVEEVITDAIDEGERLLGIDIEEAAGLYVFSLRPSGGKSIPYYVGQTCSQSLPTRALRNNDKKGFYDTILQECGYVRATPAITFLPLLTPTGRAASIGTNSDLINAAEILLIGAAKTANEDLWNFKHNRDIKFEILGLNTMDLRVPTEKRFSEMLGI